MVSEERIREAFSKIRKEMQGLREEFASLKNDLRALSAQIQAQKAPKNFGTSLGTYLGIQNTENAKMPNSMELAAEKQVSIGNEGVSALRQQIGNDFGTSKTSKLLQENVERLKQALKDTFKKLTRQEFQIFSLLYQLEDELGRPVTYTDLASRSNLTPNSLRDYISKLIAKKVPIIKEKYNNRKILLKVAPELRNIETLENLMKLVEG